MGVGGLGRELDRFDGFHREAFDFLQCGVNLGGHGFSDQRLGGHNFGDHFRDRGFDGRRHSVGRNETGCSMGFRYRGFLDDRGRRGLVLRCRGGGGGMCFSNLRLGNRRLGDGSGRLFIAEFRDASGKRNERGLQRSLGLVGGDLLGAFLDDLDL
jgi:hypothetical protein